MEVDTSLEQKWKDSKSEIIKGKKGEYKIEPDHFLGRGGFGIVYVAIRRFS